MSDGENLILTALKSVVSSEGGGATGIQMSGVEGIDPIYIGYFKSFESDNYITKFRIYTTDGYVDIDLKEKDAHKVNQAYQ